MPNTTLENMTGLTSTSISGDDIAYVVRPSTHTDYKAKLSDLKTYLTPSKPQIVATHNSIATGSDVGTNGGRSDLQKHVRQSHWVGCQDVDQLQMGIGAYWMPPSVNTGEVALGNGFTWESGFEFNAVTRLGYVSGKQVKDVDNKCGLVLSDPVGFTIPAGTLLASRQAQIVSSTSNNFLNYTVNRIPNGVSYRSPLTTSQVENTGPYTIPSGSASNNTYRGWQPYVVLGIPKAPMASVLVIGDSIADGVGDNTTLGTRGGIGYIRRGLEDVNGYSVPWHYQAVTGWALSGQAQNLSPRMRDTWKYCTHAIFALGWNDVNTGASLATMQTQATAALTELKRTIGPYGKPLHVTVVTLTPGTTSSNTFTNAAGQTARTGFDNGGIRDQYNTWLQGLVGGSLVDAIIDIASAAQDPADHTKFFTNGSGNWATSDGIHPSPNLVGVLSPLVNAWALGIKP